MGRIVELGRIGVFFGAAIALVAMLRIGRGAGKFERRAANSAADRRQPDNDSDACRPGGKFGHRHHRRAISSANKYKRCRTRCGTVPGLNVVQTGGPGGQTSVFIRGTNSNNVKVLIDGIDASDPSVVNGAFDFAHLLTGDIERIEVLRGPQSGLYGSDAIGGVISITTKKGEGPPKVTASADGGSFQTFNQALGLSGSQGAFNYAFNALHFRAGSVPVTPLDLLAPGEVRNNDNYDNWTYSTRLGADLTENLAVNLVGRYIDARHGLTTDDAVNFPPNSAPEVLQDTQRNHQLFTRGEAVWSLFDGQIQEYLRRKLLQPVDLVSRSQRRQLQPVRLGAATDDECRRTDKIRLARRGESSRPGETLVLGLEDETQSLRTDSTATALGAQTTTTARTGNKAAWVELQSEFAQALLLRRQCPLRRQRRFRPAHDLAHRARRHRSRHRNQAEGELWHRLQGADAGRALRQQPVDLPGRQSRSAAGNQQGL